MAVQSVQIFKTNNFKTNSINYDAKSNVSSKMDNSASVVDSFVISNRIAFKGNLAKVGKSFLGDADSKIGGKVRRLREELSETIGKTFRKIKGQNELPVTEKTKVLPAYSDDVRDKIIKWNSEHPNDKIDVSAKGSVSEASFREKDLERKKKESGKKHHHDSGGSPIFGNTGIGGEMGSGANLGCLGSHGSMEEYIAFMIQNRIPPYDK